MDLAAIALSWHAFWLLTLYFQLPALHQVHFLVIGQSDCCDEVLVILPQMKSLRFELAGVCHECVFVGTLHKALPPPLTFAA